MARRKKRRRYVSSRALGLDLGLLLTRFLLRSENMHFGYWPPDLPVTLWNLPKAQELYTDFLLEHVPEGARSVLDVGCGAGVVADRLAKRGLEVECVAPESALLQCARERLGDRARVHAAYFQEFVAERTYDLVVFSESYQYVPLDRGLAHALTLLNPGGHVLICDFFKVSGKSKSPIGGGHAHERFVQLLEESPVRVLVDKEITAETAPTFTLLDEFLEQAGLPAYRMVEQYCRQRWPRLTRLVRWFFRKRLAKLEAKYLGGQRKAASFAEYKTYHLVLLQKQPAP